MPFYRSHKRVVQDIGGPSMTKQSHKAECDIHNILSQYRKTGVITHVQSARPSYTDLPSDIDFQNALHILQQAEDAFDNLPSQVRQHFNHDPQQFLAAFQDPAQEDQLRAFGLLNPKKHEAAPSPAPAPSAA